MLPIFNFDEGRVACIRMTKTEMRTLNKARGLLKVAAEFKMPGACEAGNKLADLLDKVDEHNEFMIPKKDAKQ